MFDMKVFNVFNACIEPLTLCNPRIKKQNRKFEKEQKLQLRHQIKIKSIENVYEMLNSVLALRYSRGLLFFQE